MVSDNENLLMVVLVLESWIQLTLQAASSRWGGLALHGWVVRSVAEIKERDVGISKGQKSS
ncbi:hypothetical protein CIPAW_13G076000 [Carya illinoinensis]|uniref:Uncharacterized protein n=1 Tax=Carya illinoinensis TaxID=32201 RepID=A0A8T1NMR4_CARIL|nr:hypothetical protein CIPAW_13G076000 [Carya illinoinensis]